MKHKSIVFGLVSILGVAFTACGGTAESDFETQDGQAEEMNVESSAQALEEGDDARFCFPAQLGPDDAQACHDKSGTKNLQGGGCNIVIGRECQLRENDGQYQCCCRVEVLQASDGCDDVTWSDLL